MKKIFAFLIAFVYLAVSSGLAVEIHHCMGKVSDISLLPTNENKCGKCGMEKGNNKCCKDELRFVKLQDSYKLGNSDYRLEVPETVLNNKYCLINYALAPQLLPCEYNSHSPPAHSPVQICILNRVLRI